MMKTFSRIVPVSLLLALACAVAKAAPNRPAMPEALDHKGIHKMYNEGDFESVVAAIDGFKGRNSAYAHEDSVFIAKHLAVIYCANPATREKGRYYMYQLLELVPSAKLLDMYVSEEIDRIFEKVREEFRAGRGRESGTAAYTAPGTGSAPGPNPATAHQPRASVTPDSRETARTGKGKGGDGHAGLWIAGGAAVAIAGAAAYFVFSDEESDPPRYRVPATVTGQ